MLTPNKDGQYVCAECQMPFKDIRSLSVHISKNHHIDTRTYYDNHVKSSGEGLCKVCGNPTKFHTISDGYRECCSQKCSNKLMFLDKDRAAKVKAKRVDTCMKKYGVTNAGGTKESLEKAKQTHLAKRGVKWAMQSKDVVDKSKETCLKKYGTTTYVHSEEGAARVEATVMAKFDRPNFFSGNDGNAAAREAYQAKHGYDHNMHDPEFLEKWKTNQKEKNEGKYFVETDEFKNKSRATQVEKYGTWYSASEEGRRRYREAMLVQHGVSEYFQSDEFKDKSRATCLDKYGVENVSQTADWKEKVAATSLERYGAEHFMKSDIGKARIAARNIELYGVPNYANSQDFAARILERYIGRMQEFGCVPVYVDARRYVKFTCSQCGNESIEQPQFIKKRTDAGITPCTVCHPKNFPVSVEENDFSKYVESLGYPVTHYDRNFLGPYGADIVSEDKKLIIEYDGIYWHSELYKDSKYHLEKKLLAEDKGYRLVHVFSDEWKYRQDVVKSRIAYLLGKNQCRKVYARECFVGEVDSAMANDFLEHNHIQGAVNAKWRYGLFENGNLVSLMTFGSSRFDNTTEMLRFCSDSSLVVVGAAGKLFAHFVESHPEVDTLTSYADARWSTSHAFYEKLGFTLESMSSPGYFIVDGDIRRNRMQFQKHKIAGPGDEGKTEHEITLERGLYRIYDCGQYRYVWHRIKDESSP